MVEATKPVPHGTEVSAPYWRAAAKGRLVLQRCADCGKVRHYPQLVCERCFSLKDDWIEASGFGKVHSWTVAHHAFHPGFAGDVPYTLLTVDLDEGVRALGVLSGPAPAALQIGLPVEAFFSQDEDGVSRLCFRAR